MLIDRRPSLYETLNTRFVRRENWLTDFKAVLSNKNTIQVQDEKYKYDAIKSIFLQTKSYKKYSLVDLIIREILLDLEVRIDALITFNIADLISQILRTFVGKEILNYWIVNVTHYQSSVFRSF